TATAGAERQNSPNHLRFLRWIRPAGLSPSRRRHHRNRRPPYSPELADAEVRKLEFRIIAAKADRSRLAEDGPAGARISRREAQTPIHIGRDRDCVVSV